MTKEIKISKIEKSIQFGSIFRCPYCNKRVFVKFDVEGDERED